MHPAPSPSGRSVRGEWLPPSLTRDEPLRLMLGAYSRSTRADIPTLQDSSPKNLLRIRVLHQMSAHGMEQTAQKTTFFGKTSSDFHHLCVYVGMKNGADPSEFSPARHHTPPVGE